NFAQVLRTPPSSLRQFLATPRVDSVFRNGAVRLMLRASISSVDRPDFNWTPYKDFVSPLTQNATSLAAALVSASSEVTNELRAGWSLDHLRFDRAHPEVPLLASSDDNADIK